MPPGSSEPSSPKQCGCGPAPPGFGSPRAPSTPVACQAGPGSSLWPWLNDGGYDRRGGDRRAICSTWAQGCGPLWARGPCRCPWSPRLSLPPFREGGSGPGHAPAAAVAAAVTRSSALYPRLLGDASCPERRGEKGQRGACSWASRDPEPCSLGRQAKRPQRAGRSGARPSRILKSASSA